MNESRTVFEAVRAVVFLAATIFLGALIGYVIGVALVSLF